jgi:hypothetical protein
MLTLITSPGILKAGAYLRDHRNLGVGLICDQTWDGLLAFRFGLVGLSGYTPRDVRAVNH